MQYVTKKELADLVQQSKNLRNVLIGVTLIFAVIAVWTFV